MATILLDSFSIPRARHGNIIVASPSAAAPSAPAALGFRSADLMPDYNGLRSTNRLSRVSLAARRTSRRFCRRGGGGAVVCEAQDTAVDVPDVTKATWQSMVIESDKPVLVEFWAPWCGPCRIILPVLVKLSKTYEGKLKCFKLNTDDSPDIATQYGIRSIPTVMIFKNGERKDAVIGAVPESTLITCIEKFV